MELLKIVLILVLLTATSAKPMPPDADIPDKDQSHERMDHEKMSSLTAPEESKESSESDSLEESNSSEETTDAFTNQPVVDVTTAAMTTITSGDGSTLAPEPETMNTNEPTMMVVETTPKPGATAGATSPCSSSMCYTEEIPTAAPVTEIRGDM